jgi:hypothetical protein
MKRIYSILLFACAVAFLIWFLKKPVSTAVFIKQTTAGQMDGSIAANTVGTPSNLPSKPVLTNKIQKISAQVQQNQRLANLTLLWRTPLLYYGKVLDESNHPIPGVRVSYGGNSVDVFGTKETRNEGFVITDDHGIFKIDGLLGIGLMFQLSHPNYYPYPDNSTGFDVRSRPRDGIVENSEENARVFRMHTKGHPVQLVHRSDGVNVPLNGNPTELDLRGSDHDQIIGKIIIEATGTPPQRYDQKPFDWDVKVSVSNGGLIAYTNFFDFIAPNEGYQPSTEFAFPAEMAGWTGEVSGNYFLKLPSGYVRLNLYIGAKSPLFFSVQYDYNPDGSPNLERLR